MKQAKMKMGHSMCRFDVIRHFDGSFNFMVIYLIRFKQCAFHLLNSIKNGSSFFLSKHQGEEFVDTILDTMESNAKFNGAHKLSP